MSKKNVVIFNSVMWLVIAGMGIGAGIMALLLEPSSLNELHLLVLALTFFGLSPLLLIIGAFKGLHHWWGK